jgi:hypothetical protein
MMHSKTEGEGTEGSKKGGGKREGGKKGIRKKKLNLNLETELQYKKGFPSPGTCE